MQPPIKTISGNNKSKILPLPTASIFSSLYSSGITNLPPLFFSKVFIAAKSLPVQIKNNIKIIVNHAYILKGIVCKNKEKPSIALSSGSEELTAAAQLDTGAIIQIGAAVASMI